MIKTQDQHIKHFLATGEYDSIYHPGWPGDFINGAKQATHAMQKALVTEVNCRAKGLSAPDVPVLDLHAFTRSKVAPMVNGLFSEAERPNVLDMLEKSVVFLTADNVDEILCRTAWLSTAWNLANLYLMSIGAEPLSDTAPGIVGLSKETTCYVSCEYFTHQDRFADFVVHEAAHIFHNCKRQTVGLPETRTREFLLNIDFRQRETFAYACEVYSRILELADSRKTRKNFLVEIEQEFVPPDDSVDMDKFRAALSAAVSAKNGWTKILEICAPAKRVAAMHQTGFCTQ